MMTSRAKIYYYEKSNIHGGKENKLIRLRLKSQNWIRFCGIRIAMCKLPVFKVTYDEIKKAAYVW
ncbi:hypothetical protein RDV78_04555 [Bacillota bacterium LX-D]|nr:hypothetical protein [Bacillota bacterium LX-D]